MHPSHSSLHQCTGALPTGRWHPAGAHHSRPQLPCCSDSLTTTPPLACGQHHNPAASPHHLIPTPEHHLGSPRLRSSLLPHHCCRPPYPVHPQLQPRCSVRHQACCSLLLACPRPVSSTCSTPARSAACRPAIAGTIPSPIPRTSRSAVPCCCCSTRCCALQLLFPLLCLAAAAPAAAP